MSLIARFRLRRELQWQMRKANPRGLSQSAFKAELAAQKAAVRAMEFAKASPPPDPDLAYARQLAPHLIPTPAMSRHEQAEAMRSQLIARANGY